MKKTDQVWSLATEWVLLTPQPNSVWSLYRSHCSGDYRWWGRVPKPTVTHSLRDHKYRLQVLMMSCSHWKFRAGVRCEAE